MDKKTFTIILGLALIVGFFLAYLQNLSGFDLVKAGNRDGKNYVLLLIPISGLVLLLGALSTRIAVRNFWKWLPLLTVIFFLFIIPLIKGASLGMIFKNFGRGYGVGLWITIIAALILAFYRPRARGIRI
jgi:hypothetical protein